MSYSLVINGLDNAYIREYGCVCGRCRRSYRAANTSVSLFYHDSHGQPLQHVLFDVGSGVMESLMANPWLQERPLLDAVVLTHWHYDHTCELERLGATHLRTRKRQRQRTRPIPVWCRKGSLAWLKKSYHNLQGLELKPFGEAEPKGELMRLLPLDLPDLDITPLSIAHHSADLDARSTEPLPCCAGYVLETPKAKAALLWDLDATNLWLFEPRHPAVMRIQGADHLLIDCDNWALTAQPNGKPHSHASFWLIQRLVRVLKPRNTWLVHISGHGDFPGPGFGWDDQRWQEEAQKVWQEERLPGQVRVPQIGEIIKLCT